MKFKDQLNAYIDQLGCTAKELGEASGVSAATISRYRSGERLPEADTPAFEALCSAIAAIAEQKQLSLSSASVAEAFLQCPDMAATNRTQLIENFNTLIAVLDININRLCRYTNYDASAIFRFRNGTRRPGDPVKFASSIATYIARERTDAGDIAILAELLGCSPDELSDNSKRYKQLKKWLIEGRSTPASGVSDFLAKLDAFDLNEYIKVIHFDEMKVPSLPFQLPTSKVYHGLEEMMASELDFLKATVLSKSQKPVTMYSDVPMTEMAKDPEFPKKWMFGMALMLKKGLHLNQIHNLDRSFEDMMLGLESWIPMYMTGQISPYYLKSAQNPVFHHFLKVSGAAVLTGAAIAGHHTDGRYYLSKTKEDIAYYTDQAEHLLGCARPLMDIYREDSAARLRAFLLADTQTEGKRRSILSVLPLYTMEPAFLQQMLAARPLEADDRQRILDYAAMQRQAVEDILQSNPIEEEIARLSEEEFARHPAALSLAGVFYPTDIPYTYEEYTAHWQQTMQFAATHPSYTVRETSANAFRNLQIQMCEGKWAMISKGNSPAIHFVIHHPKLRAAIEQFVPPVVE